MSDLFDKNHEFVGFSHCFTCARKVKETLEADLTRLRADLEVATNKGENIALRRIAEHLGLQGPATYAAVFKKIDAAAVKEKE